MVPSDPYRTPGCAGVVQLRLDDIVLIGDEVRLFDQTNPEHVKVLLDRLTEAITAAKEHELWVRQTCNCFAKGREGRTHSDTCPVLENDTSAKTLSWLSY